jgi:ubiquinone/menaquinone biosynthesis C-methylase UbiE
MNEKPPKKYTGEVRKRDYSFFTPDWERATRNKSGAETLYDHFSHTLKTHGIDINNPAVKVLDIGSGEGFLLKYLQEKSVNAVGVDVRPRGEGVGQQVAARIEQLPFGDGTFDVILSRQAFDSLVYDQDQATMLAEISRVLKHGGLYSSISEDIDTEPPTLKLVSDPKETRWERTYQKP